MAGTERAGRKIVLRLSALAGVAIALAAMLPAQARAQIGSNRYSSIVVDAATGKSLWHFQCGASVYSSPMSFAIDGKQYVAVAVGSALFTFALP